MGQLLQMGIVAWGELRETTEINSDSRHESFYRILWGEVETDPNHLGLNEKEDLVDKMGFQAYSEGTKGVERECLSVCRCVFAEKKKG